MGPVVEVVGRILTLDADQATVFVSIDGKGGAGKSTLAAGVAAALKAAGRRVAVVHFDDFYLPSSRRPQREHTFSVDFDWERLRDEVLVPLREKRVSQYARYDWDTDALAESHEIQPGGLVLVEGVSSSRRELSALYGLRVWVDCPREERLRRGVARDGESNRDRWEREWMPSEDLYAKKHGPREAADLVVSGIAS